MVEIGGTQIDAHWLEYAAEVEPGKIVECANLAEARALGGRVLLRHHRSR